jgi:hypothetical protein
MPVDPRDLCFTPEADVYVDGSVVGNKYPHLQQASCAAVQLGRDGRQRAFVAGLAQDFLASSTCAEHAGMALAFRVLSKLPADVLSRVSIVTDSSNGVCTGRRDIADNPKLWYSGFWREPTVADTQGIRKVRAHRPAIEAIEDGWYPDWLGNRAADLWAKSGNTGWQGDVPAYLQGLGSQLQGARGALQKLHECFSWKSVEGVPHARRAPGGLALATFTPHVFEWIGNAWQRVNCKALKRVARSRIDRASCPGEQALANHAHRSRALWKALAPTPGFGGRLLTRIWFCRRRGAHASRRWSGLGAECLPGKRHRALGAFRQGVHPFTRQHLREIQVSGLGTASSSAEPGSVGRGS